MRHIHLFITLIAVFFVSPLNSCFAQIVKSDYFMRSSYLRNGLNPALRPEQAYLVIPVLPNITVNAQTNTLNLDKFTFSGADGKRLTFMHQSIEANRFLGQLEQDNYVSTDANVKLFALGMYQEDAFWNFDLGIRTHVDANIPKPFFGLLKNGFDQYNQTQYDLSDLSATGYSFIELGVSYSRPLKDENLILGTRIKVLGGLADFNLDAKSLSINAGPDYWEAKSKVTLNGSAPGIKPKYDNKGNIDGFNFSGNFGITGIGLGADFGAVYDLKDALPALEGLKISAAINDIGFISWSKKHTINLQSSETEVRVSPNDYSIYKGENASLSDILTDAFDDIKKAVNLQGETKKGRVTKLRMNVNIGAEYEIVSNKLSAGILYSVRFGDFFNLSEFTTSINYRACSWFGTNLSYSASHSQFDNFGMAIHLTPSRGINFFIASDYALPHISSEFIPTTSRALNCQIGISIPLGKKREVQ